MTEVTKEDNSCFLISLDPREGQECITSLTQEQPNRHLPLLKARSAKLNLKSSPFEDDPEEWEGEDNLMESMSIAEESHSWVTQNDAWIGKRGSYSKSRKHGKKYNRKEKSLGELCKKFIYLYGSKKYWIIALDEWTYTLGVERRRIYDIINILESFNVLSRLAKNQYEWRGISQIKNSIERMQCTSNDEFTTGHSKKRKKKKSLGILCESFIKQFLTWRTTISLEQAARRISDTHIDESKLKTKVRRLYDIANVLAALNLIEKTSLETRKPAFKWVGEQGLHIFIDEMEVYFKEHPNDDDNQLLCEVPKSTSFEFKPKSSNSTENRVFSKHFERLNSARTSSTFKILDQQDAQKELTINFKLGSDSLKTSRMLLSNGSITPSTPQVDLTSQLVELLEKLTMTQKNYPMYKPTPIYPINHFLTNPCTVSIFPANSFRTWERQFWTKSERTYWRNTKRRGRSQV